MVIPLTEDTALARMVMVGCTSTENVKQDAPMMELISTGSRCSVRPAQLVQYEPQTTSPVSVLVLICTLTVMLLVSPRRAVLPHSAALAAMPTTGLGRNACSQIKTMVIVMVSMSVAVLPAFVRQVTIGVRVLGNAHLVLVIRTLTVCIRSLVVLIVLLVVLLLLIAPRVSVHRQGLRLILGSVAVVSLRQLLLQQLLRPLLLRPLQPLPRLRLLPLPPPLPLVTLCLEAQAGTGQVPLIKQYT